MPRGRQEKYLQPGFDDVIQFLPDDKTFLIGQVYEDEAATTLSCKKCSNTAFKVGQGNHFTAIKCTACDWQLCIHDG